MEKGGETAHITPVPLRHRPYSRNKTTGGGTGYRRGIGQQAHTQLGPQRLPKTCGTPKLEHALGRPSQHSGQKGGGRKEGDPPPLPSQPPTHPKLLSQGSNQGAQLGLRSGWVVGGAGRQRGLGRRGRHKAGRGLKAGQVSKVPVLACGPGSGAALGVEAQQALGCPTNHT